MTAGQDADDEVWRNVLGTPNYLISSHGRLRSLPRTVERVGGRSGPLLIPGKIMTPTPNQGYPRYTLRIDGKSVYRMAHQLVAEAFIGPCPPGQEVRHKNDDRSNPRLSNLEYGTRADNIADCKRNGGFRNGASHLTADLVREIHARPTETAASLAVEYGVSPATIEAIFTGRQWKHLGLKVYAPRTRKGASHPRPCAKLTVAAVKAIFDSPCGTYALAYAFEVSPQTIRSIKNGNVWGFYTGAKKAGLAPAG